MQFAIKALTKSFSLETGIECETILGSSGKLTAQIQQGAPFDIFVSADMKYPVELHGRGMTIGQPKVYAYGSLVLWTTRLNKFPTCALNPHSPQQPNNFPTCLDSLLSSKTIHHIAIANPKTAPYGLAAVEVLRHYNLFEKVQDKLVYGESIAQTNQFINTQAAELGFTSKSIVLSPGLLNKGIWIDLPSDIHTPITQGIVLLKHAKKRLPQAQKFNDFLFSPKGKEILNNFGYQVEL